VVESVGAEVTTLAVGDFVIAPFTYSDGACPACRQGVQSNCEHGGAFGDGTADGGQGEYVRTPYADATLVKVPGSGFTDSRGCSYRCQVAGVGLCWVVCSVGVLVSAR
jgi:alcohol dehydrogenase